MALNTLRTNFSGLFKTKSTRVAETPQFYLNRTQKCSKHVDSMVSLGASSSVKFNHEQCKYLAEKLKGAVRSASSCIEPININTWYSFYASREDKELCLEIFKLHFALGEEVETFIQSCSKDAWVQSAILMTNVSELVSLLGFDLEFCRIALPNYRKIFGAKSALTFEGVARLRRAEGEIVKEKSCVDQLRLYKDVEALVNQSKKHGSQDRQHAAFLLDRLRSLRLHPGADLLESKLSSRPETSMRLEKVHTLGTGCFGDVHKAHWLGLEVARKTFYGPSAPDFEQEVKILERLSHPNIVSLLWYARDERKCCMVMELMDGDLYSLMQERMEECGTGDSPFSISEAIHMMLRVAEGMCFLHEKHIVHNDLSRETFW